MELSSDTIYKELRKLRSDVNYLLANRGTQDGRIQNLIQYMNFLQYTYGFNHTNVNKFKKFIILETTLKDYLQKQKKYWDETIDLSSITFNIAQQKSYSDCYIDYDLNRKENFIFEFNLIADRTYLINNDNFKLSVARVNNKPLVYDIQLNNSQKVTLALITDKCLNDVFTNIDYQYPTFPIYLKFDTKNNLYIGLITITDKIIAISWTMLMSNVNFSDLVFDYDGIGYLAKSDTTIPMGLIANFQSIYGLMVTKALSLIHIMEQNIPGANNIALSGLNSFNYLKQLYENAITEVQCDYGNIKSSTQLFIGPIGCTTYWKKGMIGSLGETFSANIFAFVGAHDNNDREHSESHRQVVVFRGCQTTGIIGMYFDDTNLHPNINQIKLPGPNYFSTPFTIDRTDQLSKKTVTLKGEFRITQTVNSIMLNKIVNVKGSDLVDVGVVTAAALDFVKKENINNGTTVFNYAGKNYLLGFGSPKGTTDSLLFLCQAEVEFTGQLFIEGSKLLYANPTSGSVELSLGDSTVTKNLTFSRYIEKQAQLNVTYLASETFKLSIEDRDVGFFLNKIDKASDEYVVFSKMDKDNKTLINPTDNLADNYIYTAMSTAGHWDLAKGANMFDVVKDQMMEKIDNIEFYLVTDEAMFMNRSINTSSNFSLNVAAKEFGWNGQMKADINTWARNGYLAYGNSTAQVSMQNGNGWYDNRSEIVPDVQSKNSWGTKQMTLTFDAAQIGVKLPSSFDYQPDFKCEFKLLSITIKSMNEIDTIDDLNVFSTSDDLIKIKKDIELILLTEKDLADHIADLDYKITLIDKTLNQIGEVLSGIIKTLQALSQPSQVSEIVQTLISGGFLLLETFFPGSVIVLGPIALLITGIVEVTQHDVIGGVFDLIAGSLIIGYYHLPSAIPYIKRFVNQFSKFNKLTNPFSKWTTRIGNTTRKIFYHVTGKYNVLEEEISMKELTNIFTNDNYTTTYNITNIVTDNTYYIAISDRAYGEPVPHITQMELTLTRLFFGLHPTKGKSAYSLKLTLDFTVPKLRFINFTPVHNADITFNAELYYHESILDNGGINYILITKDNFKDNIVIDDYDDFIDLVTKAMLIDDKFNIAMLDEKMIHFITGLALIGQNNDFIPNEACNINNLIYFGNTISCTSLLNISANLIGKYGTDYHYVL
ncbi:hypothetical protein 1 [Wuhan heteroptera virus 3]|uniref:hypothetical protein 1 n=1 Tax=Wuhan heteroptera virus 3 TaxID=1923703 RepID=UPI00090A111A|nr:hypothetical protein 1 [Wuhan heteroptera virus 3]APG79068.1 hypothetical protein 1 [Wuhan heteroptera virus 3]APG79204.1 hypothetical protein 1 [Wuhan heteroptera virus 3]